MPYIGSLEEKCTIHYLIRPANGQVDIEITLHTLAAMITLEQTGEQYAHRS
jgi:hypothetical protein